jgi:transposase
MSTKYVGIDIHQSNTTLEAIDEDRQSIMQSIIRTDRQTLRSTIGGLSGRGDRIEVALEESQLAEWAYQTLRDCADRVVVCDPADLADRGSKSDKIDANKLARNLRMDELNEVYHGDGLDRQLKELVNGYDQTTNNLIRAKNRLKALFCRQNIETSGQTIYDYPDEWLDKLSGMAPSLKAEQLYERIALFEAQKSQIKDKMIDRAAETDGWKPIHSLPGFGDIRTSQVIGIIGTPHRFRTDAQLHKYSGLAVVHKDSSEYQSTEQGFERQDYHQSRGLNDGHPLLKHIYKSAAKSAIDNYGEVREAYQERCRRKADNYAHLDIARRLATMSLICWKRGQRYDVDKARWNRRQS